MFFILIGQKREAKMNPLREFLTSQIMIYGARALLLFYGIIWIDNRQVRYDYSKWLGPQWKPENAKFTGAGTVVGNHQSFGDMPYQTIYKRPQPGYLAKDEFRKVPWIGFMAEVC